jgi:hypothetical protein
MLAAVDASSRQPVLRSYGRCSCGSLQHERSHLVLPPARLRPEPVLATMQTAWAMTFWSWCGGSHRRGHTGMLKIRGLQLRANQRLSAALASAAHEAADTLRFGISR